MISADGFHIGRKQGLIGGLTAPTPEVQVQVEDR